MGEATLYDGRMLHAGSAHHGPHAATLEEDAVRVLFYATFRRARADPELGNDAAHSLLDRYRGRFRLADLRPSHRTGHGHGTKP